MTLPLTDRQQLLLTRLVTLGEWATEGKLPLDLLEIRGFGSFFRGKPRPQDVDLLVQAQHPERLPSFERFLEILKDIRYDDNLEGRFPSPQKAMASLWKTENSLGKVSEPDIERFLCWIEPYSWKMLRPKTILAECALESPEEFANRMIKKRLPNLNVVRVMRPDESVANPKAIRCGFTVCVWAKDRSDTAANLKSVMNEACMRANAKRDRAYFEVQLEEIRALNRLYEAEIDLLLRVRRRSKGPGVASEWLDQLSTNDENVSQVRSVLRKAQDISDRFRDERWGSTEPSDGPEMPLLPLAKEVDDLRQGINRQYVRNDLLKEVRRELMQFKSGQAATNVSAKEFVVANLLSSGSKKVREERSVFLKEMNFPVQRVQRKLDDESFLRRLCGLPDR